MRVREVDVESERGQMVSFLKDNLEAYDNDEQYDWRYLRNPDGKARAWAIDDDTGAFIGVAAAFPRRVHVNAEPLLCWNLGDFAIRKDHRSLGPAITLQRACLDSVLRGEIPFAYDHPSCNMMAIYRWMGIEQTSDIVRHVCLLRVDRKIQELLRRGVVSKALSGAGNLALGILQSRIGAKGGRHAETLDRRFGNDVKDLAAGFTSSHTVVGERSPEYLNWRYLEHPRSCFEVVTVRGDQRILAYAAVRVEESSAVVADFCAESDRDITDALLSGVLHVARDQEAETLSIPVPPSSPILHSISLPGLVARDKAPFVVTTRSGGILDGVVNDASKWLLVDGDRDV